MNPDTITINGEEYVRKASIPEASAPQNVELDGLKYCIVRTYSAGVFAGFLKERNGMEAVVVNARRLWYWDGAASLSELSQYGVSKPQNCKFPCAVPEVTLTQVIEILPVTPEAKASIDGVPEWQMRK